MKLVNVNKIYNTTEKLHILKDININFEKGKFYAIMGRSGSGKSTLVNILGLLDTPTSGEYYLEDINVGELNDIEKSKIRGLKIGFVFQSFYLNKNLTALENVILPTYINNNIAKNDRVVIAKNIMDKLHILDRCNHKPSALSGGERQRVAIARALVNNPDIIIADEPTGNLDSKASEEIVELLRKSNKELNQTIIMITHNLELAEIADRIIKIEDGKIVKEA